MQPPADDRSWIEPLSSTQVIALILGLTIALVLVWAVPILAIPLAWPWLFLVPGWALVRRIAPDLPAPAQIGVGVVTSTYVSAHLVEVVATVGGFGRAAVLVSVGPLVAGDGDRRAAPSSLAGALVDPTAERSAALDRLGTPGRCTGVDRGHRRQLRGRVGARSKWLAGDARRVRVGAAGTGAT